MSPLAGRRVSAGALLAVALTVIACTSDRGEVSAPPFGEQANDVPVDGRDDGAITSVAVVGDSITVGARSELEAMFASAGLDVVALDAQEGRRLTESSGAVRSGEEATAGIADDRAPDLWVVALGTNDVSQSDPSEYRGVIAAVLSELPRDAPLVWVDVYVAAQRDASGEFNSVLNQLLAARPGAAVAPWSAVAGSDGMLRDGIHPTEAGNRRFAEVVGEAVRLLSG